jgi:hypothetical protein
MPAQKLAGVEPDAYLPAATRHGSRSERIRCSEPFAYLGFVKQCIQGGIRPAQVDLDQLTSGQMASRSDSRLANELANFQGISSSGHLTNR